MIKIGLIVNPYAGLGGAVGLKGSDGPAREKALALGAVPKANERTLQALVELSNLDQPVQPYQFLSFPGNLGQGVLDSLQLPYVELPIELDSHQPSGEDTRRAARALLEQDPNLIVFAGGDGTARDVFDVVGDRVPVLGIPAGVKIHSGVFTVTPSAAGKVLAKLLTGQLVDLRDAEVRDLDEEAFRAGVVRARHYGDMKVPEAGHFVQAVKQGGVEVEALVLEDIAAQLVDEMEDDKLYFIGSGKTTQTLKQHLGFDGTLLGIDAVLNGQCIQADVNEAEILTLLDRHEPGAFIISLIGGQGHILGRGNQQISPTVVKRVGREAFSILATKTKITSLQGRPLVVDTGDAQLDAQWAGLVEITTGYRDKILYPVG